MHAEHLRLLDLVAERDLSAGSAMRETMLRFLGEVAASGMLLKEADERRVAQGVLDYWVATLNAVPADAASAPEPVSLRLARFDPAALAALTSRADEVAVSVGAEQTIVALLMGLLQPDDARRRLVRVERDREEWTAGCAEALGLEAAQVVAVADQLVGAGLVVETTLPDRSEPVVELAARALMETWGPLARAVQARLRLRERARLWEQDAQGGMPKALGSDDPADPLPTSPLGRLFGDRAPAALPALDLLERRYQQHTTELHRRFVRRVVLALCALLAAAVLASGALGWLWTAERAAREEAEHATREAESAALRARVAFQTAEDSRNDAARVLADEQRLRRQADEALAVVRRLAAEGRLDAAALEELRRVIDLGLAPPTAPAPVPPADAPPPPSTATNQATRLTVYAHVAAPADRAAAEAIGRTLGSQFPLAGVEYVPAWGSRTRTAGQVRFYRPDQLETAQTLAARLADATRARTGLDVPFDVQDLSRTFQNLPNDRIEVWFPQLQSGPPSGFTIEEGYDRPGNDLRRVRASSLAECQRVCREDNNCQAYTYFPVGVNPRNWQGGPPPICFLKRQPGSRVRYDGMISGVRSE